MYDILQTPMRTFEQLEILSIRFNFIESVFEYIYKNHGYQSIPFDVDHKMAILKTCSRDIYYFFIHIFKSGKDAHKALNIMIKSGGNLFLFYLLLDTNCQEKLLNFSLFDYSQVLCRS